MISRRYLLGSPPLLALLLQAFSFTQAYFDHVHTTKGIVTKHSVLLGGDFHAFYMGACLLAEEPGNLYNFEEQIRWQEDFAKVAGIEASILHYVYPPIVAYAFQVFLSFDYRKAALLWAAIHPVFHR